VRPSGFDSELDDASLNRAKRGRHRVRLVRRADDDQPIEEVRISLGECESDHAAVRRADDGFDLVDADLVERGNNGVSLVMRADNSLRTPVDSASAVDEVAADELKLRRIERTTSPRDRLPPAGRGIDAVGADLTDGSTPTENENGRCAARTEHFVWGNFNERF